MARKRWRHDGPQMSSDPWFFDWRVVNHIAKLSRMHDLNRKKCDEVHAFLIAHPDMLERFRDLADPRHPHPQGYPQLWDDLLARMKEENERAAREQARRLAVLKKQ